MKMQKITFMTGKEKCEFLKGIRKRTAEQYGIPYEPRECKHEGECPGTCPVCEQEASDLMDLIRILNENGELFKPDEESITLLDRLRFELHWIEHQTIPPPSSMGLYADEEESAKELEKMRKLMEERTPGQIIKSEELNVQKKEGSNKGTEKS